MTAITLDDLLEDVFWQFGRVELSHRGLQTVNNQGQVTKIL
jgi:hypothetical protein